MNECSEDRSGDHDPSLLQQVRMAARTLKGPADLDPLIEAIGTARYVLLGEASHGTHEFYTWRAEISKRLIEEQQFSFVAVEGDWPGCYTVNRYVKGLPDSGKSAREVLHAFDRWPTWMWANREVVDFVEWLRVYNHDMAPDRQVGFYGLDVYSLWESMAAVVAYLEQIDPSLARTARRAYTCFEPYHGDAQEYARATAIVPTSCESEAVAVLRALRAKAPQYKENSREAYFVAEQNAIVARDAELYYRTMVRGGPTSWNVRDYHMVDTLDRLMAYHGNSSRGIVWEHNTHIGDARYTDMAAGGMVNVGQLVRSAHQAEGVSLTGFGSFRGSVIAAEEWGATMQRMRVPEARIGSLEDLLHLALPDRNFLLIFDGSDDGGIVGFAKQLDHRAIGVVYNPQAERWGNYVPSKVARRYDAFVFIDRSHALHPLHMPVHETGEAPETYPSGF